MFKYQFFALFGLIVTYNLHSSADRTHIGIEYNSRTKSYRLMSIKTDKQIDLLTIEDIKKYIKNQHGHDVDELFSDVSPERLDSVDKLRKAIKASYWLIAWKY